MVDNTTDAGDRLILIVEDSDEDYEAFLRALRKLPENYPVVRCADGDECLEYLERCASGTGGGADASARRPSLILLDLNLPGTDGREVLERLDADPDLRTIPVTVVTTSTNPQDVELCYRHGANSYLTKSHPWHRFEDTIRLLMAYWFTAVILPPAAGGKAG